MTAASVVCIGLLATGGVEIAQSAPQHSYRAPWVAVPNHQSISITVEEKEWSPVISFRPAQTLVLDAPVVESGKRNARLEAGTLMVAMNRTASIACQLERPKGRYFVGCVEDFEQDGRYEGFFLLNHANPFLFSAFRQPRHQKHWRIDSVTLSPVTAIKAPNVKMVFYFENRAELVKQNRFQLCVMRDGEKNMWGDVTQARGCLPPISIKDGGDPVLLRMYGRDIAISVPAIGMGLISLSAQAEAIPVEL